MTAIKPGDFVVLKSGGPVMTGDKGKKDFFDDNKVTGVVCVWFVGEKFERVRFDHRALEPAQLQEAFPGKKDACPEEATGDYKVVLDEMAAAMNILAEAEKDAAKPAGRRPKRASAAKQETLAASPPLSGVLG